MQRLTKFIQRLLPWTMTMLILMTIMPRSAAAQDAATPRILAVVGHGHDAAPTTLAEVTLGITDQGDSASATYSAVSQRSTTVTKLLKTNKVETVKPSNINLNPQYGRDGKPAKATFEGHQTIQFQLPVSNMAVLDKALATDIDSFKSIRYVAAEDAITTARTQALELAIDDAQAQAKVTLDKLGLSSQEIVNIRIDDARVSTPDLQPAQTEKSYSGRWSDHMPVEGGEQTVDVQVTLEVRY